MSEDLIREDIVTGVDEFIKELLEAGRIEEPPIDAIALAQRHLGMLVCLDGDQPQRGRAQRSSGRPHIYLRPEPTEERHQWTVAHEIGEHMKSALLFRLGIPPEEARAMIGESLANLFAYRLLVPTSWFVEDAPSCHYDVLELKKRYRTSSHEVIAWRMLDLPAACIITIVDNGHIHRRRGNACRMRRRLEPPEEECQRYVHHFGRPKVVRDGCWTVQGWPVHQAEWKREILRSVVDMD